MKKVKTLATIRLILDIIFYIFLLWFICLLCSCSATRGRDWKPEKLKMTKVMYNGHEITRGYVGY